MKYTTIKRFLDIVLSFVGIIVSAPLMVICMLLIYLEDKGNPIFKQTRIGENGIPFTLYKLRTMRMNAEKEREYTEIQTQNESDGPVFKIKDDPRITKIGKFLRKTGIDELPQLVNIITNEMSLVGPRPALPNEVACYTEHHRKRLKCKPGLTCYWQITPNRNDVLFEDWVEMDLKYIKNKSFKEDLLIILKTVKVVILMDGR